MKSSGLGGFRTPLIVLVSTGVLTGAVLTANDTAQSKVDTESAGAWFSNDDADSISHIGPAGVDSTVDIDAPFGTIEIVEIDGVPYLTDESGRISMLDTAQLSVSVVEKYAPGTELVAGGDRLYVVDAADGTVQELDPDSLTVIGPAVRAGDNLGAAVVDDDGVLHIVDQAIGNVVAIDGDTISSTVNVAEPDVDVQLSIVDGDVTAIDPTGATVTSVSPGDGTVFDVPLVPADLWLAPQSVDGDIRVPILDNTSQLALVDPSTGDADVIDLGVEDHDLGAPQLVENRVYIPDFTDGTMIIVDLATLEVDDVVTITGTAGVFDVAVDDNTIFASDPDSERAWVVDETGVVTPSIKYDPSGPNTSVDGSSPDAAGGAAGASGDEATDDETDEPEVADDPETTPDPPDSEPLVIQQPRPPQTASPSGTPATPDPPAQSPPETGPPADVPPNQSADPVPQANPNTPGTTIPGTTRPPTTTPPLVTGNGEPTDVLATAADQSATVSWAEPLDWHPVTGYTVTLDDTNGTTVWTDSVGPDERFIDVTSLANDVDYRFIITAHSNEVPNGAAVASNSVTPAALITGNGAPTAVSAASTGRTGSVTWQRPTDWHAVTGYTVTLLDASGTSIDTAEVDAAAVLHQVADLDFGADHLFQITAHSDEVPDGERVDSNTFQPTPVGNGQVQIGSLSAGDGTATIAWTPPSDWYAITGFLVTLDPAPAGGQPPTFDASATEAQVAGLTNGTEYRFTIATLSDATASNNPAVVSAPVIPTTAPPSGDGAVTNLNAVAMDNAVRASWDAPSNWFPVTGYQITVQPAPSGGQPALVAAGTTSLTVSGLNAGVAHRVTVTALSSQGDGRSVQSGNVTPTSPPPGMVSALVAAPGNAQATISWMPPSGSQTVNGYDVVVFPAPSVPYQTSLGATTTTLTVTGLTNGNSYTFVVTPVFLNPPAGAANAVSTTPVAPVVPPQPPVNVGVTVGDRQATVAWSVPSGPSDRFSVEILASAGGVSVSTVTVPATQTSTVMTGLANGTTYFALVRTELASGQTSAGASSATFVPVGPPSAPASVNATAGAGSVAASWTAANGNGIAIATYTVTLRSGGSTVATQTIDGAVSTTNFTGVATGQNYTVAVVARHAGGTSASTESNQVFVPVAPPTPPAAPVNVTATAGDRTASLSWSPGSGGGPLSTYRVTNVTTGASTTTASTSASFSSLSNGTSYTFQVQAVGPATSSTGVNSNAVVPSGVPQQSGSLAMTGRSDNSIVVVWGQASPTNGTTVGQWEATASPGGGTVTAGQQTASFFGLSGSTTYTITVVSIGANGLRSAGTSINVTTLPTPPPPPSALTGLRQTSAGPGTVNVVWNPSANAASYTITATNGSATITGATSGRWISMDPWFPDGTVTVTPISATGVPGPSATINVNGEFPPCFYQNPRCQIP